MLVFFSFIGFLALMSFWTMRDEVRETRRTGAPVSQGVLVIASGGSIALGRIAQYSLGYGKVDGWREFVFFVLLPVLCVYSALWLAGAKFK